MCAKIEAKDEIEPALIVLRLVPYPTYFLNHSLVLNFTSIFVWLVIFTTQYHVTRARLRFTIL